MSDIVIKCTHLATARSESLPEFNLSLGRGALACLLGPSDSGKTLGLRLLGGLDRPAGGSLELLGLDVWRLDDAARRELRKRVGYVPANSALLSSADALQNLTMPADYHRPGEAADSERQARNLLQWLDYPQEYIARPAAELTPCHQRMIAIARCLMLRPEILFIDDAFAMCDPAVRAALAARCLELKHRFNMTLVLATDDTEFANRYADVLLYLLPQGLRVHDNRPQAGPDGFLRLLNREGVDDYTRAIEG